MTEHEKLKEICDKIGYKNIDSFDKVDKEFIAYIHCLGCINDSERILNVREIIFTQYFIDKYIEYFKDNKAENPWGDINILYREILKHLDDPVEYLYKLIK